MEERTDEALMTAYAGGDVEAFERLYRRHRGPLYRFILRQAGDPATANDLYQGCWERIIRARSSYRPSAPFAAWMYRIARNHMVDHFRAQWPTVDLSFETLESGNPGPEQVLQEIQANSGLLAAVEALPQEQRQTLLLRLEAGLDLKAIAQVTGVSAETAKSRLRYAVDKVRSAVAAPNDGLPR